MSSATSISRSAASKSRATKRAGGPSQDPRSARLQSRDDDTPDTGFRVWHFFVVLSLAAATVAVIMSRQSTLEHLILMSLTIGAVGASAIAFYRMLAPLAAKDAELVNEPLSDRLRAHLAREKALTLRSIKELEFDRAMGKLSPQDFEEMAGRLRARAIGIMKQLEEDGSPYRALIEKELAARVGTGGRATDVARYERPQESARDDVRDTRSAQLQLRGVCACGTQNDPDARFCKSCGAKLEAA